MSGPPWEAPHCSSPKHLPENPGCPFAAHSGQRETTLGWRGRGVLSGLACVSAGKGLRGTVVILSVLQPASSPPIPRTLSRAIHKQEERTPPGWAPLQRLTTPGGTFCGGEEPLYVCDGSGSLAGRQEAESVQGISRGWRAWPGRRGIEGP